MLWKIYPFFLTNNSEKMMNNYYLYQITSPSLSPACIPYISLKKVGEKVKNKGFTGADGDVISMCRDSKENAAMENVKFMENILKRDEPIIESNGKGFPLIEMESGNNIQKSMIVHLRDGLRRKYYKYYPGVYVDLLWTPTKFVIFKQVVEGDDNVLVPVSIHDNIDASLNNPLDIDLNELNLPKIKWKKDSNKVNEINYYLKRLEWEAFNRSEPGEEKLIDETWSEMPEITKE